MTRHGGKPGPDRFSAPPDEHENLELARPVAKAQTMVEDLPLPQRGGGGGGRAIGIVVVVLVVGGIAAFLILGKANIHGVGDVVPEIQRIGEEMQRPKLPSYAPAGPGEKVVLIEFKVDPPTARLFLDGKPLESNPARLPRGERLLKVEVFEPEYEPATVEVLPSENRTIPVKLRREKAGAAHGPARPSR